MGKYKKFLEVCGTPIWGFIMNQNLRAFVVVLCNVQGFTKIGCPRLDYKPWTMAPIVVTTTRHTPIPIPW
jgi:hypothetical protein